MKKKITKEKLILYIGIFFLMLPISIYGATTLYDAIQVAYDNSKSGTSKTNVQDALDELYARSKDYCPDGYICTNIVKAYTMKNTSSSDNLSTLIGSATSVVFTDIEAPKGVTTTNLSAYEGGKIVGWLDGTTYYVSSQTEGQKILANTSTAFLFSGCSNLTSIDLSNLDTSNVTEMWDMFRDCSNLTTIYVDSGWSTENVKSSDGMFENCTKLPNFNLSYVDKTYAYAGGDGYLSIIYTYDLDISLEESTAYDSYSPIEVGGYFIIKNTGTGTITNIEVNGNSSSNGRVVSSSRDILNSGERIQITYSDVYSSDDILNGYTDYSITVTGYDVEGNKLTFEKTLTVTHETSLPSPTIREITVSDPKNGTSYQIGEEVTVTAKIANLGNNLVKSLMVYNDLDKTYFKVSDSGDYHYSNLIVGNELSGDNYYYLSPSYDVAVTLTNTYTVKSEDVNNYSEIELKVIFTCYGYVRENKGDSTEYTKLYAENYIFLNVSTE